MTILAWALLFGGPQAGFDPSWQTGLYLADHEHLQFGHQIMFTYGPLGFLDYPMLAYAGPVRLAFLYSVVVLVALSATYVGALRESYGAIWIAIVLALLLAAAGADPLVTIVAVGALGALQSPPAARRVLVLATVAGAVSALALLIKFNTGVTVAAIAVVTLLSLPSKRLWALGSFVAAFVSLGLTLWLLANQRLGNLWAFVHSSVQVASGYSQALGLEQPGRQWEYYAAALLAVMGVLAALRCGGVGDRPRRIGLVTVWLVLWYLEFKEGFVRHDAHSVQFFATLLGTFAAFRWRPGRRAAGGVMWAVFGVAFFNCSQVGFNQIFHPVAGPKLLVAQVRLLSDDMRLDRQIADARVALTSSYGLDRASYKLVRGHRVDIEPWEDSLAWAYRLRWTPAPEFQAFTAYTTPLDSANAQALAQSSGADRVIAQPPRSIDGRYPAFDAPAATRSLLCHFVPVRVTPEWAVFERAANRCGPERPLATVRAAFGQSVAVPTPTQPHELVVVRIHGIQVSGLEQIRTVLFRSRDRYVRLGGAAYRLVPGTAGDGLLLVAPTIADFPPPYRLAPDVHTIAAGVTGDDSAATALEFSFSTVLIRPIRGDSSKGLATQRST